MNKSNQLIDLIGKESNNLYLKKDIENCIEDATVRRIYSRYSHIIIMVDDCPNKAYEVNGFFIKKIWDSN